MGEAVLAAPAWLSGQDSGAGAWLPRDDALGFYISSADSKAAPKPAPEVTSPASKPGEDDSQGYG